MFFSLINTLKIIQKESGVHIKKEEMHGNMAVKPAPVKIELQQPVFRRGTTHLFFEIAAKVEWFRKPQPVGDFLNTVIRKL